MKRFILPFLIFTSVSFAEIAQSSIAETTPQPITSPVVTQVPANPSMEQPQNYPVQAPPAKVQSPTQLPAPATPYILPDKQPASPAQKPVSSEQQTQVSIRDSHELKRSTFELFLGIGGSYGYEKYILDVFVPNLSASFSEKDQYLNGYFELGTKLNFDALLIGIRGSIFTPFEDIDDIKYYRREIVALLGINVTPRFNIYGFGGRSRMKAQEEVDYLFDLFNVDQKVYGLGLEYKANKFIAFTAEYAYYTGSETEDIVFVKFKETRKSDRAKIGLRLYPSFE